MRRLIQKTLLTFAMALIGGMILHWSAGADEGERCGPFKEGNPNDGTSKGCGTAGCDDSTACTGTWTASCCMRFPQMHKYCISDPESECMDEQVICQEVDLFEGGECNNGVCEGQQFDSGAITQTGCNSPLFH